MCESQMHEVSKDCFMSVEVLSQPGHLEVEVV